jgi:hypothetical protein
VRLGLKKKEKKKNQTKLKQQQKPGEQIVTILARLYIVNVKLVMVGVFA